MEENRKNADGVPPLAEVPRMGRGVNTINNNHQQPSNIGRGDDGIMEVSINPPMNSASGQQPMEGDLATPSVHPVKPKGKNFDIFNQTPCSFSTWITLNHDIIKPHLRYQESLVNRKLLLVVLMISKIIELISRLI